MRVLTIALIVLVGAAFLRRAKPPGLRQLTASEEGSVSRQHMILRATGGIGGAGVGVNRSRDMEAESTRRMAHSL